MKLVVDTNILVSFFRENPVNKIILGYKSLKLELFSQEYMILELKKNKNDVLKYSGLNEKQFNSTLSELLSIIKLIPEELCQEHNIEAQQLSPHDKDIPVFALALKLNCPIWSNEPAFKEQSKVRVFNNRDMIELMF